MRELRRAQELLGTKDLASTIERLAGFYTGRKDPLKKKSANKTSAKPPLAESKSTDVKLAEIPAPSNSKAATDQKPADQKPADDKPRAQDKSLNKKSRYVSAHVRQLVYQKSGGQCAYVDRSTGRRCSARRRLEIDHIKPFAQGGDQSAANLQMLCRGHNLMRARDDFGERFMARFMEQSKG